MSFPKTNWLVTGAAFGEEDLQPIHIREDIIEAVSSFRYLGSVIESHGEIKMDVEDRVANASCTFGGFIDLFFTMEVYSRRRRG